MTRTRLLVVAGVLVGLGLGGAVLALGRAGDGDEPAEFVPDSPAPLHAAARRWASSPCVTERLGAPVDVTPGEATLVKWSASVTARVAGPRARGTLVLDGDRGPKLVGFASPASWTPTRVTLRVDGAGDTALPLEACAPRP